MDYEIRAARYAKGKMAVSAPSSDGFKTRAARLAASLSRDRYTHRERAYIMSPRAAERFVTLFAQGWDANCITLELRAP